MQIGVIKEAIKNNVASYLEDREDVNKATAQKITISGLKNTSDYNLFFEENSSDIPNQEAFLMKNDLPKDIVNEVLEGKVTNTFGPYEDNNFYKISKILIVNQLNE